MTQLAEPLGTYLGSRDEVLMVSGFTDDLPVRVGPQSPFHDNWDLSVARSLNVVRALIAAGVPPQALFAAGFGENHPVAPNDSSENRAKNRRVELAPVPRPRKIQLPEPQAQVLQPTAAQPLSLPLPAAAPSRRPVEQAHAPLPLPFPSADKPGAEDALLSATLAPQEPDDRAPIMPAREPQLHAAAPKAEPSQAGAN
jgi:hypothetical protein